MTTEINVFPEDSPLRTKAPHRLSSVSRLFSVDTHKEVQKLIALHDLVGIGIEVKENDKSVYIAFQFR